ncbi:MAG: hypothetical protein AAGC44_14360, partial [Planctomycetota bacterium]
FSYLQINDTTHGHESVEKNPGGEETEIRNTLKTISLENSADYWSVWFVVRDIDDGDFIFDLKIEAGHFSKKLVTVDVQDFDVEEVLIEIYPCGPSGQPHYSNDDLGAPKAYLRSEFVDGMKIKAVRVYSSEIDVEDDVGEWDLIKQ